MLNSTDGEHKGNETKRRREQEKRERTSRMRGRLWQAVGRSIMTGARNMWRCGADVLRNRHALAIVLDLSLLFLSIIERPFVDTCELDRSNHSSIHLYLLSNNLAYAASPQTCFLN